MTNKINVDIVNLSRKTDWLENKLKTISDKRTRLIECAEDLRLYWSGSASVEFDRNLKNDIKKLSDYIELLEKTLDEFKYAIEVYQSEENKISKMVDAIKLY